MAPKHAADKSETKRANFKQCLAEARFFLDRVGSYLPDAEPLQLPVLNKSAYKAVCD